MRIDRLDLLAFGHFTSKSIDLSGKKGLNIIFGPNEAGKSTAMRALECFFFGFGLKSRDAFVHAYKDLAVRAVLEPDSGRQLDLTRYKRNKNDLVDHEEQAVDVQVMNKVMGGMTRDMYARMFGLGHQGLRQGADEILKGGGHLGEALFSAASGVTSLRLVMEELQNRADELFKPRASSRPVLKRVQNISRLSSELRSLSVRPEEWRNLKTSLEKLKDNKQRLEGEIRELDASLHRHQRFYRALPHISGYKEIKAGLMELDTIPELSPEFSGRRIEVLTHINNLTSSLKKLAGVEAKLAEEAGGIHVCEKTISFSAEVDRLFRQSPIIIEAREEISSLDMEISDLEGRINEKTGLLPDLTLPDNFEDLQLSPGRIKKIENLAGELALLESRKKETAKETRSAREELEVVSTRIDGLPTLPDAKKLEMASGKMSVVPEIIKQESRSKTRIKKLESRIEKDIASLGLWEGDVHELAGHALPMRETIDLYDQRIMKASQEVEFARKDLKEIKKSLEAKKKGLSAIDPDRSIPDSLDLKSERSLRDQGWGLIKSAWLDNARDQAQESEYLQLTHAFSLAEGFEKAMIGADKTADLILEKADQVAAMSGLRLEISQLEDQAGTLEAVLDDRLQNHALIMKEWTELWGAPGISPLSPREMAAWLSRVREVLLLRDDLENEALELENIQEKLRELSGSARKILESEGFEVMDNADPSDLRALVDEARDRVQEAASLESTLKGDRKKLQRSLETFLGREKDLARELDNKTEQWVEMLTGSDLEPDKDPHDILEEIRVRQEIYALFRQKDRLVLRRNGLDRKCREFSGQTARLVRSMGYNEAAGGRPEDIISRLHALCRSEEDKALKRKNLQDRLEDTRRKVSEASAELSVLKGEMDILCREAGVDSPDELPGVEQKSALKKELKNKLEYVLDSLRELSSGEDMDDFVSRAGSFDPDELRGTVSGLEKKREEKNPLHEQLIREIFEVELKLRQMDGTSKVPELEQQVQEERSCLEADVQEFVRLRLASCILAAEIERYRSANQGPVLEVAGEIFREITLGSFSRIMADFDEKGEPVIMAQRDSGARVRVEGLSDGTRDQLFLALRLSGIYRYLEHNPSFPLMVDDILVHFDDERSMKTLSALSGLARKTQVLFFTHHRHLVDLALRIPEQNMVEVHELANS
jgi:uncharacterized protein YhaN